MGQSAREGTVWHSKPHRPSFATINKSISYNNWQETLNWTETIFMQDKKYISCITACRNRHKVNACGVYSKLCILTVPYQRKEISQTMKGSFFPSTHEMAASGNQNLKFS